MLPKLLLIVYSIRYCATLNLHKMSPTDTVRQDIPIDVIENWLTKSMLNIDHLHVNLRSDNYQEDASNSYTQWFLRQLLVPITICAYEMKSKDMTAGCKGKTNVIATNMTSLRYTAATFEKKASAYFFIISGDIDFKESRDIFHLGWTRSHIMEHFLLTNNGVFIYDPFAPNESGNYGKIIQYTGKETVEKTIFYNMRGYPLRVQIFKSIYSKPIIINPLTNTVSYVNGVDGRVSRLLQEQMNFTMNLQYPDPNYFGDRSPNGSYNGVMGSIVKNELDVCLTGFFIKDYMVPEMEFSVAVYDDKLCIFTPAAKRVPESILPIFSVRYDVWIGFILMAFVCSFLWTLLRALNLHFSKIHLGGKPLEKTFCGQYVRILIDTWVVWVRVTITYYPPYHSERIFVASLCLVSVIFGSIFESSLATVYIHPLYYKNIGSLRELDESGLQVMYKYSTMGDDLFFSETSPLFASLNKKLVFLKNVSANVIKDVAINGGKAGVSRYTNLMIQSLHFILSKQIWVVPECPKYYTLSYVWPKDAPWAHTINQLLLRMLSGGLINKYITEVQNQVDIKIMKNHLYETPQQFKTLTIEDLQLAFYVVLTGAMMAFLSLLIERKQKPVCRQNHANN